ncbi:MAG: PSD1 and planctomycete cytochrome C domain-containing protein [Rubripirellula sp.]
MKSTRFSLITLALTVWMPTMLGQEAEQVSEGEKLFALHVKPLLEEKCLACHGEKPDEIEGGLDLRTRTAMIAGGDSFEQEVVLVGDGLHSMLYVTTTREEGGFEMPPKEADQLSQEQQWWIRDWINAGAPWPNDKRIEQIQRQYAKGEQVLVSKALSEAWQSRRYESSKLWAYRPIQNPQVPDDQHPVDWFINQKLNDAQLVAASSTDARTLARRMSFGLTGLPPTPTDISRFEASYGADPDAAVSSYAAELMSSPHYGEHFGWRWLDVVRYADTAGFANDYSRPNAWRYRDYVVRAFNEDKPYNEFVRQQIAGDEIDDQDVENLIATGFLRMGPWEQTGMSVFKETRGQWLDDVTDTVGQAFLAHSMLCCKCHDHKFDPVPTRDYYRMMAVFSTTQFAEREASFLEKENLGGFAASDRWVQAKVAAYSKQKKQLTAKINKRKKQESGDAKVGDNGLDPGDEASSARMSKNIARHTIELDRTKPLALAVYTGATIHRKNVSGSIAPPLDRWKEGEIEQDVIHSDGDVYAVGDPVSPGALSAAESLGEMPDIEFPKNKGKRRLALADWIVEPTNPLAARVMVNRVWSWHFGEGIAGNPNNFGGTGSLPSHPQLLDFLALWLMENDWSIKKLNELLVTSDAYRRDSRHPSPEQLAKRDPLGDLYATFKPRRLTAEELRDAMLMVSGEMNLEVGGIPCRPNLNREVAFQPRQIMGGTASVYEPDPLPKQRNRRTLYAERIRGLRDPFLETFNQPGPDKSCELRETSIVAPQALTLINSQETLHRAIAFAERLLDKDGAGKDGTSDDAIIRRGFRIALGRSPTEQELAACVAHWLKATKEETTKTYEPESFPDRVTRTVMAEKTGEPYDFVEIMPTYTSYQPDLRPADVDARSRGLAHVLRVLVNTNEFTYLD